MCILFLKICIPVHFIDKLGYYLSKFKPSPDPDRRKNLDPEPWLFSYFKSCLFFMNQLYFQAEICWNCGRLFVRRNLSQTEPKLEETAPKISFYQWFSSPRGQKFVGYSFIVGSVAAAGGHLSLHSLLLNFVKDFFQQYTGGTPTKVRWGWKKEKRQN